MTQDDISKSFNLKEQIIENSKKMSEFLDNDYKRVKNGLISSELKDFWNRFDKKINNIKKNESENQILNIHIQLSESRSMLINKMDVIEPWFVKIEGVCCKTGLPEKEILNSRKPKPEIKIDLFKI